MKSGIVKMRQHVVDKEKQVKNHLEKKLREDLGQTKLWNPNKRSE